MVHENLIHITKIIHFIKAFRVNTISYYLIIIRCLRKEGIIKRILEPTVPRQLKDEPHQLSCNQNELMENGTNARVIFLGKQKARLI